MTTVKKKIFDGKTYKRHNAYATKSRALQEQRKLKDGISMWFENVRIEKDEKNKVRPFVVWKRGKLTSGRKRKFR